jgi:hypothetical protein
LSLGGSFGGVVPTFGHRNLDGQMRQLKQNIASGLAEETSVRFWGFAGMWWVISLGVGIAIELPSPEPLANVRLSFYVIAAGLIPTILSAYIFERRAEIRARGDRGRRIERLVVELDELEAPTADLKEWIGLERRHLEARVAFSALVPSAAMTGEVIALSVVAGGKGSAFCFAAVAVSLALSTLGTVLATAETFGRLIEPGRAPTTASR